MSPALQEFLNKYGYTLEVIDAPGENGLTALMRAAADGDVSVVNELLEHGASVAPRNKDGNNAAWLACVSGRPEIVRRLAAAGVDLDNQNEAGGATALMYSASAGKTEMVKVLLELGANALVANVDGSKAGDMAANIEILRLLRHTIT